MSTHVVAFAGVGGGEGPLSWGQTDIWVKMAALGQALAMGGTRPLPQGATVEDVEDELRYLMSRYQTFRTRLAFGADGWPSQVVHESGEIGLEIVDAGEDEDPAEVAAAVEARLRDSEWDHAAEWPVRMAVIRHDGRPVHVTLIVSHITMDGAAATLMMLEGAARSTESVSGMLPLEQARKQATPAARRQHEAAMRHWEGHLRTIPVPAVRPSRDPRSPRHWTGLFRSATLPQALRAAAAREGLDPAPALLAAFAMAFARIAGPAVVPLRLTVGNRFRPGLSGTVCPVSQAGLCVVDTAGDFPQVLRRAHGAALAAYKHAYYDRRDLDRILATLAAERGPELLLDVSLNDRRGGAGQDAPPPECSSFEWLGASDGQSSAFFLNVDGSDEAVAITLYLDSHFMAPDDAEALLWAMEDIAAQQSAAT
ncbi:condensation domain-containing protein [Dactylosporangium sp. NPDC051485]|uniref:condensation domain-containing protein n=1 Tax=Dactylosporangium sp. NPDC051485 TaxID=3154846 RepID=UPI0034252619